MRYELTVKRVASDVRGIKKITLEGEAGSVTLDEPEELLDLKEGEKVILALNEKEQGLFSGNYLPVRVDKGDSLYSAYGLLARFKGKFRLQEKELKITLLRPQQ
ncbi:MAG: hypothetical protein ACP5UI_01630 [Thermoprotei archaeon]|nr:hypothetical protein [TACK group archaeon]